MKEASRGDPLKVYGRSGTKKQRPGEGEKRCEGEEGPYCPGTAASGIAARRSRPDCVGTAGQAEVPVPMSACRAT